MAENYRPRLLILDDEEMVTTSLRNLFRLQSDYEIVAYTEPHEALSNADKHEIDVVITDYLMPKMDGISFLAKFKELQPQAIRVLLDRKSTRLNSSHSQIS